MASYHQYIEVLDGADGHPLPGWPYAFPKRQFVASPFLVDMNLDGRQELAVASKSGEIFFFGEDGLPLRDKTFKLDKLVVRKNWFEGYDTHRNVASFAKDTTAADKGGSTARRLKEAPNDADDEVEAPGDYGIYDDYYEWDYLDRSSGDVESSTETGEDSNDVVRVDPHILATPVVEDLDGDGYQEIIVPVSYYFDRCGFFFFFFFFLLVSLRIFVLIL